MSEPIIKFKGYSIGKIFYSKEPLKIDESLDLDENQEFGLSVEQSITDDLKKAILTLTVKLNNKENEVFILTEIDSYFEVNNLDTLEEIKEALLVNGTAIVYPYIRSIISMISSLDAGNAIVLPTINTTKLTE
ncbi:protein-export chaperone SecB [Lysinibacillus capsici]|uniref:protein-export chaperone SecB n=1 Tax=Lysinibacillus capsici TaxID=2115968 RepID=UPI0028BED35C|nr:protein-export chaperone SecB [Lysinibacillus capsici]WNN76754.1 protein-export chaperone SecB [Lysinibacillus capsici]